MRNEDIIRWESVRIPLGTENIFCDLQQHSGCPSYPQWNGRPLRIPDTSNLYPHYLPSMSQFTSGHNNPLNTVQPSCYMRGYGETTSIPTNVSFQHYMHSTQLNPLNEQQSCSSTALHPSVPPYSPPMTDFTSVHSRNPISYPETDVQRWRIIQYHLYLLLHAQYCRRRRMEHSAHCTNPHCRTMRNVLRHLVECTEERDCPIQHCVSSRRIIKHWKNCINADCPLCGDLLRERQQGGVPSWRQ